MSSFQKALEILSPGSYFLFHLYSISFCRSNIKTEPLYLRFFVRGFFTVNQTGDFAQVRWFLPSPANPSQAGYFKLVINSVILRAIISSLSHSLKNLAIQCFFSLLKKNIKIIISHGINIDKVSSKNFIKCFGMDILLFFQVI
jgi:hypothetical protein